MLRFLDAFMSDFYQIHKVFLDRYVYQLSANAFCTLIRFYRFYLDNKDKGKDLPIPINTFQKQILISDSQETCEEVWSELDQMNLVKRFYKQNIYELNLTEISSESGEEMKSRFRIHVSGKSKISRKKNVSVHLAPFIERVVTKISNKRIAEKFREMIKGNVEYFLNKEGRVHLRDIVFLVNPMQDIAEDVLERVCDIYNADVNIYGKKHPKYIHGILRNIENEKANSKRKIEVKSKSLQKFVQKKEESDINLGIKIATGQIQNNIAYNAHLTLQDYNGLKRLYELGVKCLTEQNRNDEIVSNYQWLKND